jgi:hypothetical protein
MRTKMLVSMIASCLSLLAAHRELHAGGCHTVTCENAPAWKVGTKYKKGDRVLSVRGNMWECKTAKLCGTADYQPDVAPKAPDAWDLVQSCFSVDTAEVYPTDVVVSSANCNGSITLRAVIANDSPFVAWGMKVAFYHSGSKVLIGVATVDVPGSDADPPYAQAEIVWNNPTPNAALITVVADDDGTGHGSIPEANELDNSLSTTLTTCPGQ